MSEPLEDTGNQVKKSSSSTKITQKNAFDIFAPGLKETVEVISGGSGSDFLETSTALLVPGLATVGEVGAEAFEALKPDVPDPAQIESGQLEIDQGSILAAERDRRIRRTSSSVQNVLARRPLG